MWPAWFPFPQCWLKALLLGLYSIPTVTVIYAVTRLLEIPVLAFVIPSPKHIIPAVICWQVVALIIFPIFAYAHVWQFFEGEPSPKFPPWLPAVRSLLEGSYLWIVTLISSVTTYWLTYPPSLFSEEHAGIIFLTIVAYFYQLRFLNRHAKDK